MIVAAVDPGREKCGLAVVAEDGRVMAREVVATERLTEALCALAEKYSPSLVVLGNGTTSGEAEARIRAALPRLPVEVADEYRTTDEARRAYWQANPPTGWRRLLPTGMQVPPVPVDDLVAVILGRRYLAGRRN